MGDHKIDRVAFLLGAGTSIPAGMPSTQGITERVLSGQGFDRFSDSTYQIGSQWVDIADLRNQYVPRVVKFLSRCKKEIDSYFLSYGDRTTNYEDLYFYVSQIHGDRVLKDNPTIGPLIDRMIPQMRDLLRGSIGHVHDWDDHELADECMNYIRDVVRNLLSRAPKTANHLPCVDGASSDKTIERINIFTLNHDLTIEQFLSDKRIPFTDGFSEQFNDVHYWTPQLIETSTTQVLLLKLHGSINWFWCFTDSDPRIHKVLKLKFPISSVFPKGKGEDQFDFADNRPMLLAGTHNKVERYAGGLYFRLQYLFFRLLEETKNLIVSGYSFGDAGINARTLDWTDGDTSRKLMIVTPNPQRLISSLPHGIEYSLNELRKHGRLHTIAKGLQDVSWQEIVDIFNQT